MSRQCTSCHTERDLSFFCLLHATDDEGRLLQTCSICRNRRRHSRISPSRRRRLIESNTTKTIGDPHTGENDTGVPLSFVRPRHNVPTLNVFSPNVELPSLNLFQPNVPLSDPPRLNLPALDQLIISHQCTTCHITRELSYFQPQGAGTVNQNRLLLTCSVCRDQRLQHQHIPLRPLRRSRRLSIHSKDFFQREYSFANPVELDKSLVPLAFDHPDNSVHRTRRLDLGRMTIECEHCHALHWSSERLRASALISTVFEKCCKKGIVPLSLF